MSEREHKEFGVGFGNGIGGSGVPVSAQVRGSKGGVATDAPTATGGRGSVKEGKGTSFFLNNPLR